MFSMGYLAPLLEMEILISFHILYDDLHHIEKLKFHVIKLVCLLLYTILSLCLFLGKFSFIQNYIVFLFLIFRCFMYLELIFVNSVKLRSNCFPSKWRASCSNTVD